MCRSCIIDGEAVVLDDNGALPIFDRLRYGPREKPEALLYAFDLLELDGEDLRRRPIEEAKAGLSRLLQPEPKSRPKNERTGAIHYVDRLDLDDGALILENACALGCEGIVSSSRARATPLGARVIGSRSRIRGPRG